MEVLIEQNSVPQTLCSNNSPITAKTSQLATGPKCNPLSQTPEALLSSAEEVRTLTQTEAACKEALTTETTL